jgi:O-antigen/teichoic acid export membrane protein
VNMAWRAASEKSATRLRSLRSDHLLRSAYSLMLNVTLTSALGFGFWVLAARIFSSEVVGNGTALVSAMIVVSAVCQLNLPVTILRFLPITKVNPSRVVIGAYVLTAVMSVAGGASFVLLAPIFSNQYEFLRQEPWLSFLYVAAVTVWGIFALQDAVLTALRRATWVPVENGIFGVLKIAALPILLATSAGQPVFVAWVVPMVMLVVPINYLIFVRFIPERLRPSGELSPIERFGWRGLAQFLTLDYLALIFNEGCTYLLPVLVVANLGSTQGAYFYMPFTIVNAFDLLFVMVSSSLTVEASMASGRLAPLVRRTVSRFIRYVVVGSLVMILLASLILLPFGSDYSEAGAPVLRLLACACIARALIALFSAISRVEGRATNILMVQGAVFVFIVPLTFVLGNARGLTGVGLAWLASNAIVACAAAPRVFRLYRRGGTAPETLQKGRPNG